MKATLRKTLLKKRDSFDLNYRKNSEEKIFSSLEDSSYFKKAEKIFIYVGFGSEIQTESFIKKYINKKEIFVPKIIKGEMKLVKITNWTDLKPGHFKILEPKSSTYYTGHIDLVITPSIVFDKQGYRLGYGKGYYDKYFSKNNYKISIGLSFEKLLQEKIPTETHDKNVDVLITEERTIINERNNSYN